jgi:hypothetical protein
MRVTPPASGLLFPKINVCFGTSKPEAGGVTLSQKRSMVLKFNTCDGNLHKADELNFTCRREKQALKVPLRTRNTAILTTLTHTTSPSTSDFPAKFVNDTSFLAVYSAYN